MMLMNDEDNDDVDHEGQNEGESVLWESERILKVLCQYLQELLRYREYRGRGGNCFNDDDGDDDDDDDDDVEDEGHNVGHGVRVFQNFTLLNI